MKIAVGIISIGISIFVMVQAMAITGLSNLAEQETMQQAGSVGVLVALLIFVGGAFTFGLPKAAGFIFVIAAILAFMISSDFPDMGIWGVFALVFGLLAFLASRKAKKAEV